MRLSKYSTLLLLSIFLTFDTGETQALECGNPQPGETNVECTSSSDSEDVIVNVQDVTDITATDSDGISGVLSSTSHNRSNNVDITVTDTAITTNGTLADGIYGAQDGSTGNVDITATRTTITTNGTTAHGIYGEGTTNHTGNINIEAIGSNITTNSNDASGIKVKHQGMSGNIDITASGNTIITTKNLLAHGIHAWVLDADNDSDIGITINLQDVEITTEGTQTAFGDTISHGVFVEHEGSGGDIVIDANAGTIITTKGIFSTGIFGKHEGEDDIRVNLHRDASVITEGEFSYGIYGDHRASGDVQITTDLGSTITTTGADGHGITAYQRSTTDPGTIDIVVEGTIHTSGADAQGVRVGRLSSGAPDRVASFDMDGFRQQTVTVNGPITSNGEGVFIAGGGRVVIGPRGSIDSESNIAILATGTVPEDTTDPNNVIPAIEPKLWVDLNLGGRRVEQALGDNWIINDGGETTIAVNNVVLHDGETGVTGSTARNGAWNVQMREHGVKVDDRADPDPANWMFTESTEVAPIIADRDFSVADFNEIRRPTPPPLPPVSELSVFMVEEPVFGGVDDVAGIYIEGDGIVYIGPMGSIRAESGIAILATEDAPGSLSNSSPEGRLLGNVVSYDGVLRSTGALSGIAALTMGDGPKLTVDMDLDGRKVEEVIGDDWIMNDGGETTLIVNDVKLHDGETGVVTDAKAANGAYDVMIRAEGVTVDRTDPANWLISDPALGVIADRDFSTGDFIETAKQSEPTGPMLIEEYAPRAALYETLPGFLLRMTEQGPLSRRLVSSEAPVWFAFSGSDGSVDPSRSTTGAAYDYDRFMVQLGKHLALGQGLDGRFAVHYIQGDSDVSSPTGGGDIDAEGTGAAFDIQWHHASGYYLGGHASLTNYDIDLSSDDVDVGRLKSSVDALGASFSLEAGMRLAMGERLHLTPRAWLSHSSIDIDSFTDTVDARASFSDETRLTGGIGALAQTMRHYNGGELTWHGSLDIEQRLNSRGTSVDVSGEKLKTETASTRLLLGLGSLYRKGDFSISARVSTDGLGTNDEEYSGQVNIGVRL